jgi:PiT family inorganic phosphate transporter
MADALTQAMPQASVAVARPALDRGFDPRTAIAFFGLLAIGVLFVAFNLFSDISASGAKSTTILSYLLLFVALLTALGFEFFNGFHDAANAVATVPAPAVVVWSGGFNFLGVLLCRPRARIR